VNSRTDSLNRRRLLAGLAVAAGSTILAACGGGAAQPTTKPAESKPAAPTAPAAPAATTAPAAGATTPPVAKLAATAAATVAAAKPAAASKQGEVTFVNWEDIKGTPLETVIQTFETQTGQKVAVQPTPGTGTEYETKMRTMLAGGAAPDIMRTNDDYVRYYSVKDQVLDLTPYIKRDNINFDLYAKPIMDFARQPDGRYTAWSLGNQPLLIFYNIDQFTAAGVPMPPKEWTDTNWKWDNFLDAARKLTKPNERWGALIYDATAVEQVWPVNNGEEDGIFSKDGKQFNLANPKAAAAIQWAADLTCKHQVQPERGLVTQANSGNNLFASGKVSMIMRGAATANYFRRNVKDFKWDVAPIPGNVKQMQEGSLICFTVTKQAKNPDGAWELLKFMGGPAGAKIFAETKYFVPALKQAGEFIKADDQPPATVSLYTRANDFNTAINFTENTERARTLYRPELDLVWTCQTTAAEAFAKVKKDVEDALAGKF
jgi:multiple sugar transport system substrate-binding protein